MMGKLGWNCPLFAESATMQPFPQNGHFGILEWPFYSNKDNLHTIYLSQIVFLGSK